MNVRECHKIWRENKVLKSQIACIDRSCIATELQFNTDMAGVQRYHVLVHGYSSASSGDRPRWT